MSVAALLKGTENWLRSASQFNDQPAQTVGQYFGVMPAPGKPPPRFGQYWVSVHFAGGRGADPLPERWDAYYALTLTLTARLNYAPKDRQGVRLVTASDLYALVDTLTGPGVIHGSWDLIAEANELITGTAAWGAIQDPPVSATVNGFVEPLVLDTFGPERPATGDWIGAAETKDVFVIDMRFRQARRIRPIGG